MALPPRDSQPSKDGSAKRKAEQDVFVREVDDALRQDEMMGLFNRYGIPLIVLLVVGLAGLGGYLWWDARQHEAAGERGEQMVLALDRIEAGQFDSADKMLAMLAEEGGTASATAAQLLRGGVALEQGRRDDAVKLFAQVAADRDAPQPYRDLATVRQMAADFDQLEPQVVIAKLKPLAAPGNPWFGVAGELVGAAYLKQGKPELAGPLFAQIARDATLPESLRGRARQMAGLLGVDAIDDVTDEAASSRTPNAAADQ